MFGNWNVFFCLLRQINILLNLYCHLCKNFILFPLIVLPSMWLKFLRFFFLNISFLFQTMQEDPYWVPTTDEEIAHFGELGDSGNYQPV